MSETPNTDPIPAAGSSAMRTLLAISLGLAGSTAIWLFAPFNNEVVPNTSITDGYLPIGPMFFCLILVLLINPALRRLRPGTALDRRQLAIIFGMMLAASAIAGFGLLRLLPYSLARTPVAVNQSAPLAEEFSKMDLPPSLFPDPIGYGVETPAGDGFLRDLLPGEQIPWSAWVGPLISWGILLVFCWLMMLGLALICLPQWRNNERLAFPLLQVQHALIADPEKGKLLPRMLRSRKLWIAAGVVIALRLLNGANLYFPERVPSIPLKWDLANLLTEAPWSSIPGKIRSGQVYFIMVGISFFMPTRISFSIWFTMLAYAAYRVIGSNYFPPFQYNTPQDHRNGAVFAMAIGVLYLGRAHWARVFGSLFRRPRTFDDRRNRSSGTMFLLGLAGMFLWLMWAGVQWGWALFYVVFAFVIALVISRVVAESGMPFVRLDFRYYISLVKVLPRVLGVSAAAVMSPVSLFFSYVIATLFPTASLCSVSAASMHALSLDETKGAARHTSRRALGLLCVLVLGLIVCGGAHLWTNYNHSSTLDGRTSPVNAWGTERFKLADTAILELRGGQLSQRQYNQPGHLLFGAALAGLLQWLCLLTPRWPLHPIGLVMVNMWFAKLYWASIFMGWFGKVLLVRFGGARAFRAARPFFLGLILGDCIAAVFWAALTIVLVAMGVEHKVISVL